LNHLAHALLGAAEDRRIVGALLSDFVKGDGPDAYSPPVREEILLHRHVDVVTDAHPVVREALASCFVPARRRFAGIALDVHFDHVLARRWSEFGDGRPLVTFTHRVYDALDRFDEPLPPDLALLARRWRQHDGLAAYADRDTVDFALDRLAGRLSRGGEHLRATREDLDRHAPALERAFERLWPDLRAFVASGRSVRTAT
jgi:acyl carrier protein phosphodiesterase